MISNENPQYLKVVNINYITIPEVLKFLKVTTENKVKFTFKDDKNEITEVESLPETIAPKNMTRVIDKMPVKPLRLQCDYSKLEQNLYWYKFIPDNRILYFQYNQCIDRDVAQVYGLKDYMTYPVFTEFTDKLFKVIKGKDINKLVVDMRFNGGGDSSLMSNFVYQLESIDKLKGKIYIIVGRNTCSSAVINSIDFKQETKAVIFGEETGGNVNGYGEIKNLVLPNSKLNISYSTKYFKLSDKYKRGVVPDVTINESFERYRLGIDDIYDAIINYKK